MEVVMSPRPDVSEERRSQIIESAIKVFAREGIANTRMDDVANESGLSKGLLYWYFKSKEEIIMAIADFLFSTEFRKIQNISIEGQTAHDCLEDFSNVFIQDLQGILKLAPIIYEFYALAFRNTTVRRMMHEYLQRFVKIIEPIVQYGMDHGEFTPGNAQAVSITIGATFEGTLLLWAYAPDMFQPEKQLHLSMQLLLQGINKQ
jgi:AcrR family transcriptional regulator